MIWSDLRREAEAAKNWILSLRRQLHKHPELMYEEFRTSQLVQDTLSELQIPFEAGIAETGVVGTLGSGDGPCIALRADMDALPIQEAADVEFRSEVDGKMHACGHDCHTAMLLGAAKVLKQREESLKGTVKLIFQPAEEGGAGGKRMSDAGVLANPNVSRIFGLHVWPMLPTGTFGSRAGTFLAAAGELDITIHGRGGHAAMPHQCIDPVVTAAKVITELQTIVSRELDPMNSAVISITSIHGGEAYNVIPEQVKLQGTIRALDTDTFQMLQKRIEETATQIAAAAQCRAEVAFPGNAYPATVNDDALWETVQELAGELVGSDHVHEIPALMGGEDFAFFAEQVPGCFVGLGIRNEDCGATYSVHHPMFKVDEDALPLGTALHACFAVHSLSQPTE
ncbi:MAG TPA: amidohydrolase [Planctomycetaceae bacterium]|nr:amidohydrolase [Planctomycetaceae bacterium]